LKKKRDWVFVALYDNAKQNNIPMWEMISAFDMFNQMNVNILWVARDMVDGAIADNIKRNWK